ncbi:regulator of chromosome condensation-like isoform X2 [Contarinia nasturtii]|uniref:regulator of chromosome condensation-like isoform X2 n=1 Tax=Contarinia nasturtii TaxID=265458 RepID=UPI0012D38A9C|nr:regulator of chromosome condensation-like isoform X2 [Contarinia nasturtii]
MSPSATKISKRKAADLIAPSAKARKNEAMQRTIKPNTRNEIVKRLDQIGNLLVCGQNEVGQLGLGEDVTEKTRPALLADSLKSKVVDISAGGMHSLYLTVNGEVWSFGCNDEGALGRDTTAEGSEYEVQKVDLPKDCIRITAGDSHSAFLLSDGRVYASGSFRDSHGTMGLNMVGKQQLPVEVVPVGCGEQGQLGRVSFRSSSGKTRRGKSQLLEPGLVTAPKINFIDAIWATTYCTFIRTRSNQTVYGFGLNNYNQIGIVQKNSETIFAPKKTPFENVKEITGGQHHTLVLTNDNKCYAIGRTTYGRCGVGDTTEEVIDKLTPINTLDKLDVVQLECGESCSFAISADGKVYSWGFGSSQQLGLGSDDDQLIPTKLTGAQVKDRQVINVSSGGQHTLFIAADKAQK